MRAVIFQRPGPVESLELAELPDPVPGPAQVLIRVATAGVNFADTMVRAGVYPGAPEGPAVLGNEVVGTVAGHGPGVSDPPLGQRVAALVPAGGYAELVVADAEAVVVLEEDLDDRQVLAVLLQGLTATGLLEAGGVRAGHTVLVTAAAGGVGSLAVQLAVVAGARVIGLAGATKLDAVRDLGAEVAIDYTAPGWEDELRAAAGGGVDVVLDSVGGRVFDMGVELLSPLGRLVVFGAASGRPGALSPGQTGSLIGRSAGVIGYSTGATMAVRPELAGAIPRLLDGLRDGSLRLLAGERHALADAAEAHRALETRRTTGKVVLTVAAG